MIKAEQSTNSQVESQSTTEAESLAVAPGEKAVDMCFICDDGAASATPRLCLRLVRRDSELSRKASQFFDDCLHKSRGSPARKDWEYKDEWMGKTLENIFQKAELKGIHGFLEKGGGCTAEGSLTNIPLRAVGVGKNKEMAKRSLFVAMSVVILLHLQPTECNCISHVWGMHELVKEAWRDSPCPRIHTILT